MERAVNSANDGDTLSKLPAREKSDGKIWDLAHELSQQEKDGIPRAMEITGGNYTQTAAITGYSRGKIIRKVKKYNS